MAGISVTSGSFSGRMSIEREQRLFRPAHPLSCFSLLVDLKTGFRVLHSLTHSPFSLFILRVVSSHPPMNVVEKIQRFLSNWAKSGEPDWYVTPRSTSLLSTNPLYFYQFTSLFLSAENTCYNYTPHPPTPMPSMLSSPHTTLSSRPPFPSGHPSILSPHPRSPRS